MAARLLLLSRPGSQAKVQRDGVTLGGGIDDCTSRVQRKRAACCDLRVGLKLQMRAARMSWTLQDATANHRPPGASEGGLGCPPVRVASRGVFLSLAAARQTSSLRVKYMLGTAGTCKHEPECRPAPNTLRGPDQARKRISLHGWPLRTSAHQRIVDQVSCSLGPA